MELIRIRDHVQQASTYEDGQVIFELIAPHVRAGAKVALSFEGFLAVPSAFVNAALVQLLEIAPADQVRQTLAIKDSTKAINELIKRRFEFVDRTQ